MSICPKQYFSDPTRWVAHFTRAIGNGFLARYLFRNQWFRQAGCTTLSDKAHMHPHYKQLRKFVSTRMWSTHPIAPAHYIHSLPTTFTTKIHFLKPVIFQMMLFFDVFMGRKVYNGNINFLHIFCVMFGSTTNSNIFFLFLSEFNGFKVYVLDTTSVPRASYVDVSFYHGR